MLRPVRDVSDNLDGNLTMQIRRQENFLIKIRRTVCFECPCDNSPIQISACPPIAKLFAWVLLTWPVRFRRGEESIMDKCTQHAAEFMPYGSNKLGLAQGSYALS